MFKWIIFSKYTTNLKTAISKRSLRIISLVLLLFLVIFIKDIIDNIIYVFYHVTRTPTNGRAVYWLRYTDGVT